MPDHFPTTERTRMKRRAKRATYDADTIHAIFDEALISSVAVAIDGAPHVQPMIHCRLVEDEAEKKAIMTEVFSSLVGSSRLPVLPALPDGYLGGTMIVVIPIEEAVGKVNSDVPTDDGPDGVWSGFVPVSVSYGEPEPDARTAGEDLAPPADLTPRRKRG